MNREIGLEFWMNRNGYGARVIINGETYSGEGRKPSCADAVIRDLYQSVKAVYGEFNSIDKCVDHLDIICALEEARQIIRTLEKLFTNKYGTNAVK